MSAPPSQAPDARRRVVLISDSASFGGAEVYAHNLAKALSGRYRFTALMPDADGATESRDLLAAGGVEVWGVPGLNRRPTPSSVRQLGRLLSDIDPDLVHVNLSDQGDGTAALIAALRSHRPAVATLHLLVPDLSGWRERLSARLLKQSAAVIAVSGGVAAWLEGIGATVTLVRNGVPQPQAHPDAREALGLQPGDFAVGGIGRLHHQKGWDLLCKAAPLVRAEAPDTRFIVIGEGEERGRLAALEECGAVGFPGYRSRAQSLLAGFDLLAVPSRYEGLPLTAIEAMLSGLPVVATRVGGLPEVLGGAGTLVPPEDPWSLAQAIVELAGNPGRRAELGERGRRRAKEQFSVERMASETESVYAAVISGTPPRAVAAFR